MDFHYHHYFQTSIIRHPSQDKKTVAMQTTFKRRQQHNKRAKNTTIKRGKKGKTKQKLSRKSMKPSIYQAVRKDRRFSHHRYPAFFLEQFPS
jgi:hypothetical protein